MTLLQSTSELERCRRSDAAPRKLEKLPRALVLLSGTVRSTRFHTAIGRSPLGLPITDRSQLLDHWEEHVLALSRRYGREVELRVLLDRNAPMPVRTETQGLTVRLERDALELRGTGGILRDLAAQYDDDDFIFVASGAQLLVRPLYDYFEDLAAPHADVAIAAHNAATSSVLLLIRCGCLRAIADVGFVDLKEQALPIIAASHRVVVREWPDRIGLPIRSESQYIAALRWYHAAAKGVTHSGGRFEEDWECRFNIIEQGAIVAPDSLIHDSVILRGGMVGRGAAVVRSLVCDRASIRRGATVSDALVARNAKR